jgi:chitinase
MITSIKVAPGLVARLYENEYYAGKYVEIKGGNHVPNLATLNFDNKASSIKFVEAK